MDPKLSLAPSVGISTSTRPICSDIFLELTSSRKTIRERPESLSKVSAYFEVKPGQNIGFGLAFHNGITLLK